MDMPTKSLAVQLNTNNIPVLAQQLSQTLVDESASDLHLTPRKDQYHVSIRRHGLLQSMTTLDKQVGIELINHWKVQACLDLTLKDLPQDGSILSEGDKHISLRISTCPTLFGEKMVLRLHAHSATAINLDQLGMTPVQQHHYHLALQESSGLILIAGPTGSGKTTTLYAGLKVLAQQPLHIMSVEDPVEVHMPHVTQVNIHANFGFAEALRTALRQDPDVLMIGEIRDRETAQMAIGAAQTGHLVLATVHAHDNYGALMRMKRLGVCLQQLIQYTTLLMSQQLLRTGKSQSTPKRMGVYETLIIRDEMKHTLCEAIKRNHLHADFLKDLHGPESCHEQLLAKLIKQQQTSWEEIRRVFGWQKTLRLQSQFSSEKIS